MITELSPLEVGHFPKECYIAPECSIIELELEGCILCSSCASYDSAEDFIDGGEYGRSSRGW